MSEFDVVIDGGILIDGTGAEPVPAHVGIRQGRIAEISAHPLQGAHTIDAAGMTVTPGFIDLHSHADSRDGGHPQPDTQLHQGVTTLVTSTCGISHFPIPDPETMLTSPASMELQLGWELL